MSPEYTSTNRILVVDDDATLIGEYLKCLGENFEPDAATTTLGDLERVLFGEDTDETGAAKFNVQSRTQGAAAVEAVRDAADACGLAHRDIVSGAGHDACFLSHIVPVGMIFVPCEGGISHNEAESATPADLAAGCEVLLRAMLSRAMAAA